jgi:hypothetical protein
LQQLLDDLLSEPATVQSLRDVLCGNDCYRLDIVIITQGSIDPIKNESLNIAEQSAFQQMWPGVNLVLSSLLMSGGNLNSTCTDFAGINYDCMITSVDCPSGQICGSANQLPLSQQIPCSCDALRGIENCTNVISNVCQPPPGVPVPPTQIPSWVIPTAVCVGAGLLVLLIFLLFSICCCCCFCCKSKKSVYFTEERTQQELSAYIYNNRGLTTYHNTGDVDEQGYSMGDAGTFQKTTTFTFMLGHQRPKSTSPPPAATDSTQQAAEDN